MYNRLDVAGRSKSHDTVAHCNNKRLLREGAFGPDPIRGPGISCPSEAPGAISTAAPAGAAERSLRADARSVGAAACTASANVAHRFATDGTDGYEAAEKGQGQ